VTCDSYYRNGQLLDKKKDADQAEEEVKKLGGRLEKVLVWRRHQGKYSSEAPMVEGRDFFVDELLKAQTGKTIKPVSMDSEATLFLMYTSGSTGRPKGAQHRTGGYLAYVAGTSKYVQDIHPEDVYCCFADIGWITGHSYIVYGPLAVAATSVMYEGVPMFPDVGRIWRIAERLGVNIFHTAPTTIRMLRKAGPEEPRKHNYHFKCMTTVGEPIEPETWHWFYDEVGKGEAAITDTWWQTETGGFLCSTVPAVLPMKPGSAGPGMPGIYPVILDDEGREVKTGGGAAGNICIRNPWPGIMQTIWEDPDRFVKVYYERYCKNKESKDWRDWPYFSGDGAVESADGYYRILGRIDDVIKVAGHRLGTKELENAALTTEEVGEAAAVAVEDELRGHVPVIYVSLKPGYEPTKELAEKVRNNVAKELGPIARPKSVYIVPDLPKTRSGKIMRRILVSISENRDYGDVTTLANAEVVERIRDLVLGKEK
jgi:acetyl-CoA synthetase